MRSSAETVWRLFFTRWWISRMVASLLSRTCSRRRISVTSRTSMTAPARRPSHRSGIERRARYTPPTSTSVSQAWRPMSTTAMVSSTGVRSGMIEVTASAS